MTHRFNHGWRSPWLWVAIGFAFFVVAPIGVILSFIFHDASDVWIHLSQTILPDISLNTFWLLLGVGLGTLFIGSLLAWITSFFDFPGRGFFDWALMLPLAMPAYVLGFVWIGLLDYSGPFAYWLRSINAGFMDFYPSIRSRGGIIFVMTLALYPYVYLLARNAFLTQGRAVIEAARSLGMSQMSAFLKVSLPMARPWIFGGLMLVLMETLADFGTVSVFNYDTFTTGIYKAWFHMFSLPAAAQLSSIVIGIIFLFLIVESTLRGRRRYALSSQQKKMHNRYSLKGAKALGAFLVSAVVFLFAFSVPFIQLSLWTWEVFLRDLDMRYLNLIFNTCLLGVLAAVIISSGAVVLSFAHRQRQDWGMNFLTRIATMGYAVPGTVLAVGVYLSLVWMDKKIVSGLHHSLGWNTQFLFTGTILAMLMAYTVRFMAIAHAPVDGSMQRITQNVEEAARNFGYRGVRLIRKIQIPMMKEGLMTAGILICVEVMKEMPITLMTRPFGWDTLAVRIFEMTSEGEWERAALPSFFLVIVGFVPILLLTRPKKVQVL